MAAGKRVLVTRSAEQAGDLAEALRSAGLEPVLLPMLTFREVPSDTLDRALAELECFDWLVLTSVNAVKALRDRLARTGALAPPPLRIAVVGASTGSAVQTLLLREPELVSPEPVADVLAQLLVARVVAGAAAPGQPPQRFLVVRAQEGREVIEHALRAAGAKVTVAAAYATEAPAASLNALREMAATGLWPDAATFTSPSTARNLLALLEQVGGVLPGSVRRIAIGPVTARALAELGIPAHVTATQPTPAAMTEAVLQALAR